MDAAAAATTTGGASAPPTSTVRRNEMRTTTNLIVPVEHDVIYEPETVASVIDVLLAAATSTEGVLDEIGDATVSDVDVSPLTEATTTAATKPAGDDYGLANITFMPDACETYEAAVNRYDGYGVTLTLKGGERVEAVLAGTEYSEDDDVYYTSFYRVTDNDWPVIETIRASRPEAIEKAVAIGIEVH
jgi:hypothetical protein